MDEREKRLLHNKGLLPEDYYFNANGLLVYTERYHLKRGYCCRSGCRHCPYGFNTESEDRKGKGPLSTPLPGQDQE